MRRRVPPSRRDLSPPRAQPWSPKRRRSASPDGDWDAPYNGWPAPEPGRSDEPPDLLGNLEQLCDSSPRQLLPFLRDHTLELGRLLARRDLSPAQVYTLLRTLGAALEQGGARQPPTPLLALLLTRDFILGDLLRFITELDTFQCREGRISQEVVGDTVVALHRLLTACPGHVPTLLCYPVDLLFCTVQRLQSRGFQFSWLIQQRLHDARRLVDKAFPHRHRPAGAWRDDFREVPVIPAPEELFGEAEGRLRPNLCRGAHESAAAYLDLHFRLLREDFLKPLRDGIAAAFSLGGPDGDGAALSLYRGVQLHAVAATLAGPVYLARFLPRTGPAAAECLKSGSLTCLLSEDCSHVLFGVVAGVPKQRAAHRDRIWLHIQTYRHRQLLTHLGRTSFTMVESPAFFEAYRHVLEGLQELSPTAVPFGRYLVHCKPSIRRPAHLGADRLFSLAPLLPDGKEKGEKPAVDLSAVSLEDPEVWSPKIFPHLDESQLAAIRLALSREFVLIQGPPGTGKTFIGLKITELLLRNQGGEPWGERPPLLVVCYTNHALDQFMEGILQFQPSKVVRIGGKCRSKKVMGCSLQLLRQRALCGPWGAGSRRQYAQMRSALQEQEKSIAFHTEVRGLLHRGILTASELETEIMNDDLLFKVGVGGRRSPAGGLGLRSTFPVTPPPRVLCIWTCCSGCRCSPRCRRRTGARGEARTTWQARSKGPGGGRGGPEVEESWEPRRDERCLDEEEEFDPAEAERRRAREKFAYIIPEEEGPLDAQLARRLQDSDAMTDREVGHLRSLWQLRLGDRWRLYRRWLGAYGEALEEALARRLEEYEQSAAQLAQHQLQEDLQILRQSRVIGMTTTGAAKYRKLLQSVRPQTVIVEEAAEILEAHVLTCLTASCKHLILIGDHQQLRPKPADYTLEKKYRLGISLFERMINNEIPHVQLLCQHRMRPEISQLLVPFFYEALRDHPAVGGYEKIKGVESSVFFIQHAGAEDLSGHTGSYSNRSEAAFLVHLCKYLLEQGYAKGQLTVLTPYSGQVATIRQLLARRDMAKVAVCTVDDFQGEESDIVLLSLVRSNPEGRIGFLGDRHRICVAFSRARKGFYCIGDLEGIARGAGGRLWAEILAALKSKGLVGDGLALTCQNHPEVTATVRDASDFRQSPEGGCTRRCRMPLPCGHPCPRHCHPRDREHRRAHCCLPCARPPCERGHPCPKLCWEECGPCLKKVEKVLPRCGHRQRLPCHVPAERWRCQEPCPRPLACGHPCPRRCGDDCGGDDCGRDDCRREDRGGDDRGGDDRSGDSCGGDNRGGDDCSGDDCSGDECSGDDCRRDDCSGDDCGGDNHGGDDCSGDDCGGHNCGKAVEGVLPHDQPACTQKELAAACQESSRQSLE
ncbi:LOW QUALITY PROTEIN: NFX1-type zinc finger-containing protein 1-like [Aquila chrysaetos chrysaetos]|uniref:LOW QUALITY PROTEIN: NFX1-type zinc finger-containing protein 1-like n=1 Tax=Aquila chrysaetos chrysaetos TaxID=223781 RepID=UPI001B7D2DFE|nr:LOW QUALITY PROTEIN: NFX1-type zinc finger-containing protein 1-like [Aquila chrysaetos chrysaetos]